MTFNEVCAVLKSMIPIISTGIAIYYMLGEMQGRETLSIDSAIRTLLALSIFAVMLVATSPT